MIHPEFREPVRAILLDIEGTTTTIAFVHETLFPYARRRLAAFLARHGSDPAVLADLAALREEHAADAPLGPPPLPEGDLAAVPYLHWLMDLDRKSTPLKSLQGAIWREGYRAGDLKSEIFPDVPPALARWRAQGRRICIYSSGSVLAQQQLFAHTTAGDLTAAFSNYFDTRIGPKRAPESYAGIAQELALPPAEILFLSDIAEELQAAHQAGLQTALSIRPGNAPQTPLPFAPEVAGFDEVFPVKRYPV
ncbi:MAG: acireductone synthase [Blastocatellia bacterium]|nr:acireductone synthase [Blastocatellia bacterium]